MTSRFRVSFARSAAFALAALSAYLAVPARAAEEEEASPDASSGLSEVDSLLRRRLEDRIDREAALEELEETIGIVERLMLSEEGLSGKRQTDFEKQRDAAEREIEAMNRAVSAAHDDLDEARRSIELASPLLLQASRKRGPGDRRSLALALVHSGRRREAGESIERIFDIEERKGEKTEALDALIRRVSLFAEFARLSKPDMRSRHGELKREAAALRAELVEVEAAAKELGSRRTALAKLADSADVAKSRDVMAALAALGHARAEEERAAERSPSSRTFEMGGGPRDAPEIGYEASGPGVAAFGGAAPPDPALAPPERYAQATNREVFLTPPSDRLHALADATVAFCSPFAGYETLLILDHGAGWLTVYANLSASPLREGDAVKSDQVVGTRASGGRRGDPLWIEVRQGERAVPVGTLPGAGPDWKRRLFGS